MDQVIRNVREIATPERRLLEHVIGRALRDNQQVIIQVVTPAAESAAPDQDAETPPSGLPEWCNVFAGLSAEQVAEIDAIVRQRAELGRSSG